MRRGIYRVANAPVKEQTIALVNSIPWDDSETTIGMIPSDENYHQIAEIIPNKYGV